MSEPAPPAMRPVTVLLVDDQAIIGESIRATLAPETDISYHFCQDPRRAVAMAIEVEPTVILQDLVMPELDGLSLVKLLREEPRTRDIPLVVLSTKEEPSVKAEAFRLGANDYLVKLPSALELVARIRYHSAAYLHACQIRLAYEALLESQRQLRSRNVEIGRQRDQLAAQADELEKRNQFIKKIFGRYLSNDVVESLLASPEGPELGGETRVVTILMSDLRGFTASSERLRAEQVVRALNNYLGAMANIITSHKGTIDEFIGDAILAIFGAPISADDDAARAIACAVEMQNAMEGVNAWNETEGLPAIEMGIALHTGEVVVGNIGSTTRTKYGVVGSSVNLVARIESCTVGGQVLVSETTLRAAGDAVVAGKTMLVHAKGFREPITTHEVLAIGGAVLPERADPMTVLEPPLPVRYAVVREKEVSGAVHAGHAVRLSPRRADLALPEPVAELTNLRVRFLDATGAELAWDLYGKVVASAGSTSTLHFTSCPPELGAHLLGIVEAARQHPPLP
ncbi:MAG: adenylate/guanylate cyclase domain-containing protein [Acidobacteriota bacterium]